jgi:hypothetical protein
VDDLDGETSGDLEELKNVEYFLGSLGDGVVLAG